MLTLDSILNATRQMTSYGEQGTGGAQDHMSDRVQGQPQSREVKLACDTGADTEISVRRWDNDLKIWRFD